MEEKYIEQNIQDKFNFGEIMGKINDLIGVPNISETILETIEDVKKLSIDALQTVANEYASDIKKFEEKK
jgi:hypothetical protein